MEMAAVILSVAAAVMILSMVVTVMIFFSAPAAMINCMVVQDMIC